MNSTLFAHALSELIIRRALPTPAGEPTGGPYIDYDAIGLQKEVTMDMRNHQIAEKNNSQRQA
jgi:hypothetical protein